MMLGHAQKSAGSGISGFEKVILNFFDFES